MIDDTINELLQKSPGSKLAYLTEFGSKLYGTSTPESDTDYKGLFWPSNDSLIQCKVDKSLSSTTGDSNSKNSKDDVDVQLWSVHYWLNLLRKGDTNAIDLLFSMYSSGSRITEECGVKDILGKFYNSPIELLDLRYHTGHLGYVFMQTKKYGIKSSRMDILRRARDFFASKLTDPEKESDRVKKYFDELISKMYNSSLCFEKETNGERCVWICGKGLTGSTSLKETVNRLTMEYAKYGKRAELARQNIGIDWKAVSHAVRACIQIIELAETGFLVYPLKKANLVLDVKLGKMNWVTEVEPLLNDLINKAKNALLKLEQNPSMEENHAYIISNYYSQFIRKD